MSPPVLIDIRQMIDLALGTPELGVVNFNVLHSLLHVMAKEMQIHDTRVELRGSGTQVIKNLMSTSKPSVDVLVSQYTIQREAKSKSSTHIMSKTPSKVNITFKKETLKENALDQNISRKKTGKENTLKENISKNETLKENTLKEDISKKKSFTEEISKDKTSEIGHITDEEILQSFSKDEVIIEGSKNKEIEEANISKIDSALAEQHLTKSQERLKEKTISKDNAIETIIDEVDEPQENSEKEEIQESISKDDIISKVVSKEFTAKVEKQSIGGSKILSDQEITDEENKILKTASSAEQFATEHSATDFTDEGFEKIIIVERVSNLEQPVQGASSLEVFVPTVDTASLGRASETRGHGFPHLSVVTMSRYKLLEKKVNKVEDQLKQMQPKHREVTGSIKLGSTSSKTSMVESWQGLQAGSRLQALEEATAQLCDIMEELNKQQKYIGEPQDDADTEEAQDSSSPKTVFEKLTAAAEDIKGVKKDMEKVGNALNDFKNLILDELKLDVPKEENISLQTQIDELKNELLQFFPRVQNENLESKRQINLFQDQLCYFEKEITEMWKKICENKKRKYSEQNLPVVDLSRLETIQDDLENLNRQILTLQEEKDSKDQHIHLLFEEVEILKKQKVSQYELEDALKDKVEQPVVNRKVSLDQFDAAFASLARCCAAASSQAATQTQTWTNTLQDMQQNMDNKLSKQELEGFACDVYEQLSNLKEEIAQLMKVKQEHEAAGVRSKFIKNVNCISCNKNVIMNKFNDGVMPLYKSVPPHNILQLHPNLENKANINKPAHGTIQEWSYRLEKQPNRTLGHVVSRYCGGSHTTTTPQQRVLRAGNFLTQWGLQAQPITHATTHDTKLNVTRAEISVGDVFKHETKSENEIEPANPVTPKISKADVATDGSKLEIVKETIQTVKKTSQQVMASDDTADENVHPQLSTHEIVKPTSEEAIQETEEMKTQEDDVNQHLSSKKPSMENIQPTSKTASKQSIQRTKEVNTEGEDVIINILSPKNSSEDIDKDIQKDSSEKPMEAITDHIEKDINQLSSPRHSSLKNVDEISSNKSVQSKNEQKSQKSSFAEIVKKFSGNADEGKSGSIRVAGSKRTSADAIRESLVLLNAKKSSESASKEDTKVMKSIDDNDMPIDMTAHEAEESRRKSKSRKSSTSSSKKRSSKSRGSTRGNSQTSSNAGK